MSAHARCNILTLEQISNNFMYFFSDVFQVRLRTICWSGISLTLNRLTGLVVWMIADNDAISSTTQPRRFNGCGVSENWGTLGRTELAADGLAAAPLRPCASPAGEGVA